MTQSSARTICVVTGSRAEYGLLRTLMTEIRKDPRLALHVIATGMHLSQEFGLTFREIERDGFSIDDKVHMLLSSDDDHAIAKSVGIGVMGFADVLARVRPDVMVVLGDRFEILAAAQAAMLLRIPVAHIHGGEATEGAIDEGIRHAITKMSQLHFTAAEPYRQRVVQLGEDPSRVFSFGAPGLDAVLAEPRMPREELEADLGISLLSSPKSPLLLCTYHPATLSEGSPVAAAKAFLAALDRFPSANIVLTKPNADAGGREIAAAIDAWGEGKSARVAVRTNLGMRRYLSVMKLASAVVGNSSSGLIEAPAFRVPTVNVGDRQKGRLSAASVIDCAEDTDSISAAITRALSAEHQAVTASMTPPYGATGDVSRRIAEVLATVPLEGILQKRFFDLEKKEGST